MGFSKPLLVTIFTPGMLQNFLLNFLHGQMKIKEENEFSFIKPAIYRIKVYGRLHNNWSERLGGMQINETRSKENNIVSVLVGQINDQTALSGVLNMLYESHLTILSVNMLNDKN
jgi:hypothetical protein